MIGTTISHYIKRHPELAKVCQEAAEATLDLAESKLIENIRLGKEASIFFFLKCKGKSRVFIEKEKGISIEAFHRALEQLALVVVANVKDDATLDAIEEGWRPLKLSL